MNQSSVPVRIAVFCAAVLGAAGCSDRPVSIIPDRHSSTTATTATATTTTAAPSASLSATASAAPSVAPDARSVSFTVHGAKVGERFHERLKVHGELEASAVIKTIHSVWDDDFERDVEVLSVAAGSPTKIKVTYTRAVRTRTMDGVTKPNPGPIEGRSYLIERNGRVSLSAMDGRPISEPEETEIRNGLSGFGKPDVVAQALASKPRRVGERMDDVALAMKTRFEEEQAESAKPGDLDKVSEMTATLARVDGPAGDETATVEISSSMAGVKNGADMTLVTHGTEEFRVESARLVRTHVDGTSTLKGLLSGAGKMIVDMDSSALLAAP